MEIENHPNYFTPPSPINWDEYFMLQAMVASFRSKDPSTKVGCVLVDENNHQVSMGYNGFIAGIDESKLPWGKSDDGTLVDQKYGYIVHAEANAILHANSNVEGTKAYVTLFPCNECAKLIASKKITEVIFLSDKHSERDYDIVSKRIFDLTGVKYRKLEISNHITDLLIGHLDTLREN